MGSWEGINSYKTVGLIVKNLVNSSSFLSCQSQFTFFELSVKSIFPSHLVIVPFSKDESNGVFANFIKPYFWSISMADFRSSLATKMAMSFVICVGELQSQFVRPMT